MAAVAGYQLRQPLKLSLHSETYLGSRVSDGLPVIVKIPQSSDLLRARMIVEQEFEVLQLLENCAVPKILEVITAEQPALVLQYIEGDPLDTRLAEFGPARLYNLAIGITEVLCEVHEQNVVHKDIKLSNIVLAEDDKPYLVDFGASTSLESKTDVYSERLLGSLAYMSPEQTGRIQGKVDLRTDLYSLGVMFYKFWVGDLPFNGKTALELIHQHLSLVPVLPTSCPVGIAAVILHLLEKSPDSRYQSAAGLLHDLRLVKENPQASFVPGEFDTPNRLFISHNIYQREHELDQFFRAFERILQGETNLILIEGAPGIGKSAFVETAYQSSFSQDCTFLSASFLSSSNLPLSGIKQLIKCLCDQLLTESQDDVESLINFLGSELDAVAAGLSTIDTNVARILDVELDVLPAKLSGHEKLLDYVLLTLFSAVTKMRPLVIFIDDAQWLDQTSQQHLAELLGRLKSTLFIVALRNEECGDVFLSDRAAAQDVGITRLALKPLSYLGQLAFLQDTFNQDSVEIERLQEIFDKKTAGIPIRCHQFLQHLSDNELISLNDGQWLFDLPAIDDLSLESDAADLIGLRLQGLSAEAADLLFLAALYGPTFSVDQLHIVSGGDSATTARALRECINIGALTAAKQKIEFSHERVRAAIIASRSEQAQFRAHTHIGKEKWLSCGIKQLSHSDLFSLSENVRLGDLDLYVQLDFPLAELFLRAGDMALVSSDWPLAKEYLELGLKYAGSSGDAVFELEILLAKAEAYLYNNDLAKERLQRLIDSGLSDEQLAQAYLQLINVTRPINTANPNRLKEREMQCDLGIEALTKLGLPFSRHPTDDDANAALTECLVLLPEIIAALGRGDPGQVSPLWAGRLEIINAIGVAAYVASRNLTTVMIAKAAPLVLTMGICAEGMPSIMRLAIMLTSQFGRLHDAHQLAEAAMNIIRKLPPTVALNRATHTYYKLIRPWNAPLSSGVSRLIKLFDQSIRIGDIDTALECVAGNVQFGWLSAYSLPEMKAGISHWRDKLAQHGFPESDVVGLIDRICDVLTVIEDNHVHLDAEELLQHLCPDVWQSTYERQVGIYQISLLFLLLGHHQEAADLADESHDYCVQRLPGTIGVMFTTILAGLSHALVYSHAHSEDARSKALGYLSTIDIWADESPLLFKPFSDWIRLEIEFDDDAKMFRYGKLFHDLVAIGLPNFAAILDNQAALFAELNGLADEAQLYRQRVDAFYKDWGAKTISHDLLEGPDFDLAESNTTSTFNNHYLELTSLSQLNQSLAGLTSTAEVVEKLMEVALQNSGADRGVLLRWTNDKHLLIAEGSSGEKPRYYEDPKNLDNAHEKIPLTVVHYVYNSMKPVVVRDCNSDVRFQHDAYVAAQENLSVLCVPVTRSGKTFGLLYLENKKLSGVFTPDRITLLQTIAAQAVVALDNARLLDDLKESTARYKAISESETDFIAEIEIDGSHVYSSANYERFFNLSPVALKSISLQSFVFLDDLSSVLHTVAETIETGKTTNIEFRVNKPDGSVGWFQANLNALSVRGKGTRALSVSRDISARKNMQQQLAQEQKLDALGQLAGGVAHDFNNLLTVIHGNAELMRLEISSEQESLGESVDAILHAASLSTSLTGQLLAFSRKQVLLSRDVVLNDLVADVGKMLRRLLDETIELNLHINAQEMVVNIDPSQMEQVIINLALNAKDAMPKGGKLDISVYPDLKLFLEIDSKRIPTACIEVTDTGHGMSEPVMAKMFEPFFTTKSSGKGTGLGLSMIHGIVKQSKGSINVASQIEEGASFQIHLPLIMDAVPTKKELPVTGFSRQKGLVLVVEDDEMVRKTTSRFLKKLGFEVMLAEDGQDGLEKIKSHHEEINLVVSDLVMPRLSGAEMISEARKDYSDFEVLFMTGYNREIELSENDCVVRKPFTFKTLVAAIDKVLTR